MVSVVAKSNTGKTRLLEGLIPVMGDMGIRVGVIKHHSHPGTFDTPGKDTHRIALAGAEVVVGLGPDEVAVFSRTDRPVDLEDAVRLHLVDMDIVFTEGYKRGPYPKVEVHRMERSGELLCDPSELIALVTDGEWDIGVPTFGLDEFSALAELLVEEFGLLDSMTPR